MFTIRLTMFPLLLLFHFSNIALAQEDQEVNSDLSALIDELVLGDKKLDFSGSVLVAKDDQILHRKNYGLDTNLNYSYWIGSLSKQFCAAAILRLQDKDLLSVDDSIARFLKNVPDEKKNINIHQLLTHTSGLGDNYAADRATDRTIALRKILAQDLVSPETYSYSSDGYQLLAILVEEITGMSYESFLQEQFFDPLTMTETGFSGDKGKWNSLQIADSNKKKSKGSNPQNWPVNYGFKGPTGILTSTRDLMIWKTALFSGKVLSANGTRLLFVRHVNKTKEVFYGYGWNLFDSPRGKVTVHSGADDFISHNSTLRYYNDEDMTIIVLSNSGYFKGRSKARVLASKLISIITLK